MARRLRPASRSRADLAAAASAAALTCGLFLAACDSVPTTPKPGAETAALMDTQLQAAKQAEATYNYSDALGIYQTLYSQHPSDLNLGMSVARNLRFSGQPGAEI